MYLQKNYIFQKYKKNKKFKNSKKQKKCLGENLETGALVAKIQKKIIIKSPEKKNLKNPSGENLETSAT